MRNWPKMLADCLKRGFRRSDQTSDPWVLVVGDVMLDRYLWGSVERISPEAPVPVVRLESQNYRAGGAANVAANLAGLGISCRVLGVLGDDEEGRLLKGVIASLGVFSDSLVVLSGRVTTTKTRVIGGHQQMLRLDREADPVLNEDSDDLIERQAKDLLAEQPDVVILSDYAKGVLSARLCRNLIDRAQAVGIPVLVDPKGHDYSKYQGATALTPNLREIAQACQMSGASPDVVLDAATELRRDLGLDFMVVTCGERGMVLLEPKQSQQLPATARQVFDVSGAGDTVIATLAAGLVGGLSRVEALRLANMAAGIVVGKVGTVPIQKAELLAMVEQDTAQSQANKICSPEYLVMRIEEWRGRGERIVFTNGCFDLLHVGHVTYLDQARKLGDRLVVGLNTDASVSALKGPTRPVIREQDRARLLAALEAVDAVVLFEEDTPIRLIELLRPDVLAKGGDYREDQVVGAPEVRAWGGEVALLPIVPGISTSAIVDSLARH